MPEARRREIDQRPTQADPVAGLIDRNFGGSAEFEAFTEFLKQWFVPVRISTDDVQSFEAKTRSAALGAVRLSNVWAQNTFEARRTRKHIASGAAMDLKVGMQLRGVSTVSQGGQEATLRPGDFVVYDTDRPYQLSAGASFRMRWVMFSRNSLPLSQAQLDRLCAQPINGREGLGALLSNCISTLAQQLSTGSCSGSTYLADATLDLIAASFSERLGCTGTADVDHGKAGLLLRVRAYIDDRLGDPGLDVPSIAAAHHISLRNLQRLFETDAQTVTGWIRARRIDRCRKELTNAAFAQESVRSIAAKWGITDQAHFSRLFKATYGLSPREYRARALAQLERTHRHVPDRN